VKWPSEKETGDWQEPPDAKSLREKLLLLACDHRIGTDELVLAARVELHSAFYDVHYHVWWEESGTDQAELRASDIPRTISARSFCWWFGKWWEPETENGEYPVAFVPGGSQRLAHSFVNWFPSRLWMHLEWRPEPQNPLVWTFDGKPIVRYERMHGRLRETQNYHHRQPILERWVVKREGFEMLRNALGGLRRHEDIDQAPSPER
jgi:hypothetical protein